MVQVVSVGEPLVELAAQEALPVSEVTHFRRGWGGDTWNFAVAAARASASVGYITRVGTDDFGRSFLRMCRQLDIDSSQITTDSDRFTGLYLVGFDEDHNHSFTYFRTGSAASALSTEAIDADYIRGTQALHTSGITQAISESARQAAHRAMAVARESDVLVTYDANLRPKLQSPDRLRELFLSTIGRCDIVFLSEQDAHIAFGDSPQQAVLDAVLEAGAGSVVLKRGEKGCVLATERDIVTVEGFRIDPRDASGAGDAFAAVYVVELINGLDPVSAATHANAAGALTAAGLGTVAAIPTRADVVRFLQRRSAGEDISLITVEGDT